MVGSSGLSGRARVAGLGTTLVVLLACGGRSGLGSPLPGADTDAADAPLDAPDAASDAPDVDATADSNSASGQDAEDAEEDVRALEANGDTMDTLDAPLDAGNAGQDAGIDASGICPGPPLLTGNGAPLAPSNLESLALGNEHSCLLLDGEVWCWGQNAGGELGDGTQASRARPTRVTGIATAVAIASGPAFDYGCFASRGSHTCALLNDATVTCWGSNVSGDVTWLVQSFVPSPVPGLTDVTAIGIAGYNNCAVLRDGGASCWGVAPVPVPLDGGLDDVVALAAGAGIVAAVHDETVWSWSAETDKGITTITPPTQVPGLSSVVQVAVGWGHQCALRSDGTVWCWGYNYHGELGDGTLTDRATPVQAIGVVNAVQVITGGRSTCALLSSGSLMCWGDNTYGQIGIGSSGGAQPTPVVVPTLSQVREIGIGLEHACAVRWDLSVWCWGGNETGQVGDGTTINRPAPVQVFP